MHKIETRQAGCLPYIWLFSNLSGWNDWVNLLSIAYFFGEGHQKGVKFYPFSFYLPCVDETIETSHRFSPIKESALSVAKEILRYRAPVGSFHMQRRQAGCLSDILGSRHKNGLKFYPLSLFFIICLSSMRQLRHRRKPF